MASTSIQISGFADYPPLGKKVATEHFALLQRLPTIFAAILLRGIIDYDWRFPAERADIDRQLRFLGSMSEADLITTMFGFASLPLPSSLENSQWALAPAEFAEKLTAHLWTVHQIDHFRDVAKAYQDKFTQALPEPEPAIPRLCIAVVGKDATPGTIRLFDKLRPHGTIFSQVKPAGGLDALFTALNARAKAHPAQYAHWYVDGGTQHPGIDSQPSMEEIIPMAYATLEPLRNALLQKVSTARTSGFVGPEDIRSMLAQLRPDQLGTSGTSRDPLLRRFELTLLTEGAGTQIFSTTFVQWAGRELLRRARPLTLMLRFAPRQVERPMNELLVAGRTDVQYDPAGSLVDADMGAFYTWINLMRLRGADQSRFIAWFEDQREALVIAPGIAKNAASPRPCDLPQILGWIT